MTPQAFVDTFGAYADDAAAHGARLNRWTILTQWALESGWGTSPLALACHNLAGIKFYHEPHAHDQGGFGCYDSLDAFRQSYIDTLNNGYYAAVLATEGQPIGVQLAALGASPWDAGHYNSGAGPGSSLVALFMGQIRPLMGTPPPPLIDQVRAQRDQAWVRLEEIRQLASGDGHGGPNPPPL